MRLALIALVGAIPAHGLVLPANMDLWQQQIYLSVSKASSSRLQSFDGLNWKDFWERALKLGSKAVTDYSNAILANATGHIPSISEAVDNFKLTMNNIVESPTIKALQYDLRSLGTNMEVWSQDLSIELDTALEDFKTQFPLNPDEAPHHNERAELVRKLMDKVEDAAVRVTKRNAGVEEGHTRKHFRAIRPGLERVLVTTGDLAEQHPEILEILLFSGVMFLLPEIGILRPIFSVFGFGPEGPVKGSAAAWAQRRFFGGFVTKGSWFSRLQSASMRARIPRIPSILKIIGSIGAIIRGIAGFYSR